MKIKPNIKNPILTRKISGYDENLEKKEIDVIEERPLTLYLNSQEIVTMMTINDYPDYLAVGYLLNQNMLVKRDIISGIDFDDDTSTIIVRTERKTNFENKLKKKTLTSGCAQGTVFGDVMENFNNIKFDDAHKLKIEWIYELSKKINLTPSLYLKAGAIHGCVLCKKDIPIVYMEDVGRHNAIDKIAGYMFLHNISSHDKIFYTTGRLTSEMVIKSVQMRIPIIISRSGFTAWGVELANQANLTLIGRAKGKKFIVLSGEQRIEK